MKDGYILLTKQCNNDCLFCSVPKEDLSLSLDEAKAKIDNFYNDNYEQITLTGGEPFSYGQLYDVISYVKSKNMSCRITTNGTYLDLIVIKKLIKSGLDYINVSIHSFESKLAKKISDNPDYNLSQILTYLKYLSEHTPITTNINITISKLNYKHLTFMANYIVNHLPNLDLINFNYVDVYGNVVEKDNVDLISLRYYISEKYILDAFKILKDNNRNFRVERIPLCYLFGFIEYASDFNRAVGFETAATDFIDRGFIKTNGQDYVKSDSCKYCSYSKYCFGVNSNYEKTYGTTELYPIFSKIPKEKFIGPK